LKRKYAEYYFMDIFSPLQRISTGELFLIPHPGELASKIEEVISLNAMVNTTNGLNIEVMEKLLCNDKKITRLSYIYQAYNPQVKGGRSENGTILRYDCSEHHPHLENFPHHKHVGGNKIVSNYSTTLQDFVEELEMLEQDGTLDRILSKHQNITD